MRTRYGFARKATYSSGSFLILSTWQCHSMDAISKVVITVNEVLDFSSRCNDRRFSVRLLRPSWFFAPEDLSEGCDITSFLCNNLDFQMSLPSWRMQYSVFSLQWSRIPIGPFFSSGIEGYAERTILILTVSLIMITYLTQFSKFTV